MEGVDDKLGKKFLFAAERGRVEQVQDFLDAGVPINYQDPVTGKTALHEAAGSCARPLILAMIKNEECDFLIRDKRGRLASELAFVIGDDPALARLLRIKEVKQAKSEGITLTRRPRPEAKPA